MIFTLAWKEVREHRAIWLTMVVMTVVLGFGLARIAAPDDQASAVVIAALTILGMAATYGVVCGSMMFAGEHEGGTLIFLDIFLGRRDLLWLSKFLVGLVLVLAQALAVAFLFYLLKQTPPAWGLALVGRPTELGLPALAPPRLGIYTWFLVLPVMTLEAYCWGLLGSSLTRRVLAGAAIAVVGAAPVWLFAVCAPPQIFFALRLTAAVIVLVISCSSFLAQQREASLEPLKPDEQPDPRKRFLQLWEDYEKDADFFEERPLPDALVPVPVELDNSASALPDGRPAPPAQAPIRRRSKTPQAHAPGEVLWWLTFQQAWGLLCILAGAAFVIGTLIPIYGQVLWPFATLLLGVACGTAAFASEQRDLSYQFLATQHFPLKTIWRFKILFWLIAAALGSLLLVLGGFLLVVAQALLARHGQAGRLPAGFRLGTLRELMGPVLFFGIWLVYGFCIGQVFVWLCRKSILALLLSGLVASAALGFWLPSLLCGGMSGWQLWVPPLTMLLASRCLVRAWAGGRIKERRPLAALAGFGLAAAAWIALNFGFRAWEIPDVREPLNPAAFRASLPAGKVNAAGKKIQDALAVLDEPGDLWLARIADVPPLPVGVIETPRDDGHFPLLQHLPACQKMIARLRAMARAKSSGPAWEHLAQILALSRNLRSKATLQSYLAGIDAEESALADLELWLARGRPAADLLRRVLGELNRHAAETPSVLDCLQTECFLSGGFVDNPQLWTFSLAAPGVAGKVPERWLIGGIALSLEMPWEAERKTRLWRVVWAGLFRGGNTAHWQLPTTSAPLRAEKPSTRQILAGWLPAAEGPGASVSAAHLARLLDTSWLSDTRLFPAVVSLRGWGNRSRCGVDAARHAVALGLYQIEEGKTAQALQDLVPKYLPELPTDPYSGLPFRYRISPGEKIERADQAPANVRPGQGVLWSTGPDRVDHGGHNHGWSQDFDAAPGLDRITVVPHWP